MILCNNINTLFTISNAISFNLLALRTSAFIKQVEKVILLQIDLYIYVYIYILCVANSTVIRIQYYCINNSIIRT